MNYHHKTLNRDLCIFHCYMQDLEDILNLWYIQGDSLEAFQYNQQRKNMQGYFQHFDKLSMHRMEKVYKDLFVVRPIL